MAFCKEPWASVCSAQCTVNIIPNTFSSILWPPLCSSPIFWPFLVPRSYQLVLANVLSFSAVLPKASSLTVYQSSVDGFMSDIGWASGKF